MKGLSVSRFIARVARAKKAKDVCVLNVRRWTIIAEYFVIMSATSAPHRRALMEEIEKKIKEKYNVLPTRVDGRWETDWTAMDYASVLVHIFIGSSRETYRIEKLYSQAREIRFVKGKNQRKHTRNPKRKVR